MNHQWKTEEIFKDKCRNCKYFTQNDETYPFCIACAYCRKKKHILQINLDGTLPVFCQVCYPKEWKKEFNTKTNELLKKCKN